MLAQEFAQVVHWRVDRRWIRALVIQTKYMIQVNVKRMAVIATNITIVDIVKNIGMKK